jgi:hypothetical protein
MHRKNWWREIMQSPAVRDSIPSKSHSVAVFILWKKRWCKGTYRIGAAIFRNGPITLAASGLEEIFFRCLRNVPPAHAQQVFNLVMDV